MTSSSSAVDFEAIKRLVFVTIGIKATSIDQVHRDETRRTFKVVLEDQSVINCSLLAAHIPSYIIKSEVATMRYIRDHTNIPVSRVLAYEADYHHPWGLYLITEQIPGIPLDVMLPELSSGDQDVIVAQIARWTSKLFRHRFSAIGSLYANSEDGYIVGPIVSPRFFTEGRAQVRLDRGPFTSAKDYLLSCTQREIDCMRTLLAQDASMGYQRDLEDCRLQVDQTMSLMTNLIQKCKGLDDSDHELAPFSLDFHEMSIKNFILSESDPTRIVAVTGWSSIATKPLWQCGRLPRWLQTSMSDGDDDTKVRLAAIFRYAVMSEEGRESMLLQALNQEGSTRCSLHDLCDYDAFKDGFLLRPTLESIAATLPGEEDMEGLQAILDPSTVTGRVARISLMTTGSAGDALALAFSDMNVSDFKARDRSDPQATPTEVMTVSR
ncbi:hypothetical protein M0805_009852 [Coniferiporia weirii]|nr:hypothetical protein M0805_009852 [Coniferiporia weirii]